MHRETFMQTHRDSTERRTPAHPTTGQRARQIRGSPLSIQEGILTGMRNSRQIGQANRAVRHLKLSNRREHGLQGRLSPMGAINPGWRIMVRFKQSGDNRGDHAIGAAISKVWVSIQSRKSSGICLGFMWGMRFHVGDEQHQQCQTLPPKRASLKSPRKPGFTKRRG